MINKNNLESQKKISFFEKYFTYSINVDRVPNIITERKLGYGYLALLIIIISIISGIYIGINEVSKIKEEYNNLPNFVLNKNGIEIIEEEKTEEDQIDKNDKFLNYKLTVVDIYPNMTNKEYIEILDNARNKKMEAIEEGTENKEIEIKDEEAEKKEKLLSSQFIVLKDSIHTKISTNRYLPFKKYLEDKTYTKKDIEEILGKKLVRLAPLIYSFVQLIAISIIAIFARILANIYIILSFIIGKRLIYAFREYRIKVANYALSGPITIYTIFTILTILGKIEGINMTVLLVITYIIYLEIISRILQSDQNFIKQKIVEYKQALAGNVNINMTLEELEENKKNREKKLKELEKENKKETETKEVNKDNKENNDIKLEDNE